MTIFDASTNPDRVPFAAVLRALAEIARAGDVSMLVVGATARDVALAADGHTAAQRATNDVDIAIAVVDAAAFESPVADLEAAIRTSFALRASKSTSSRSGVSNGMTAQSHGLMAAR